MRVAIVDPSNYTPYYCDRLCAALAPKVDYLSLVTSEFTWDGFRYAGNYEVRYHFYRCGNSWRKRSPRRIVKGIEYPADLVRFVSWLRRQRIDIVHWQWAVFPLMDQLCIWTIRMLGWPVVYTAHNILPHSHYVAGSALHRMLYRTVDHIIVHTEASAQELTRLFGTPRGKVSVIAHGPLLDNRPNWPSKVEARRALGLSENKAVILFFGNVRRHKGVEVLLEAFRCLHKRLPVSILIVAGKLEYALSTNAYEQEGVITDFRYLPERHVMLYLRSADVTVLPYLSSTQSGVLFASLAASCPVIVTDVGGLGETVRRWDLGVVVPPSDRDALSEAMSMLLKDPSRLSEVTAHIARWREQAGNWDEIASRTLSVYETVRTRCERW